MSLGEVQRQLHLAAVYVNADSDYSILTFLPCTHIQTDLKHPFLGCT